MSLRPKKSNTPVMVDFREGISMTADPSINERLRSIESKLENDTRLQNIESKLENDARIQRIESKLTELQAQHIMAKADPGVEEAKRAVFAKLAKLEARQRTKPTADQWLSERQRLSALQASL